jgi:hypothetical protein
MSATVIVNPSQKFLNTILSVCVSGKKVQVSLLSLAAIHATGSLHNPWEMQFSIHGFGQRLSLAVRVLNF